MVQQLKTNRKGKRMFGRERVLPEIVWSFFVFFSAFKLFHFCPMLTIRIALRYIFALRKASTVQLLSLLSFLGIFLGSLAMMLVLSAFNGFEGLLRKVYHYQDPDFRVETIQGKYFVLDSVQLGKIPKIPGVTNCFEILEDKASLVYGDGQMVVTMIGISPEMVRVSRLDTSIRQGRFSMSTHGDISEALVSIGIQKALNISLEDPFSYLKLAYPKRKKILKLGSGKIFNQLSLSPSGILQMDENRVYVPISKARQLMDKPQGMNYLDVFLSKNADREDVREGLTELLGAGFRIKDEDQQHESLYKVMMIEKLFVFLALGFIILISTFNLFVSSTMLVLDKSKDIRILAALGMEAGRIASVIRWCGGLITLSGMVLGLCFGLALCWIQIRFGLVPLGMSTTLIKSYPIEVRMEDVAGIALWVWVSGWLAMVIPGKRAFAIAETTRS
jgi:lipoprotein-releasing system permease protein